MRRIGVIILSIWIIFLLSAPTILEVPISRVKYGRFGVFSSSNFLYGGDGFDESVFDWVNLKELKNQLSHVYNFEYTGVDPPIICIVDSGFDEELWLNIYNTLGRSPAESITYVSVYKTNTGYAIKTYKFFNGRIYRYRYSSYGYDFWISENIPPGLGDTHLSKHGSSIIYLLKSLSPNVKILAVRVPNIGGSVDYRDFEYILGRISNGIIKYVDFQNPVVRKIPFKNSYILRSSSLRLWPDVLSISIGFSDSDLNREAVKGIRDRLNIINESGIGIFVASGNYRGTEREPKKYKVVFPANVSAVYAVGSIYDEGGGGRIEGSITNFSRYGGVGIIDFSEPGYDVETRVYDSEKGDIENIIVAGTSYSAPIAALLYSYVKYAAKIVYNNFMSDSSLSFEESYKKFGKAYRLVKRAFIYAAENALGNMVPKPSTKSPLILVTEGKRDRFNGYGTVDVYDAIYYVGFLARKLISGGGIYLEGARTVPFRVNVTLSHDETVAGKIYENVFSNGIYMYYKIYEYGGGKRLVKTGKVHMVVENPNIKRHHIWIVLKGSVTFTVKKDRSYIIELYWDFSNTYSFLFFNDLIKIHVKGVEPYPISPW